MPKVATPEEIKAQVAADEAKRVHLPQGQPVEKYLELAEAAKPALIETPERPLAIVKARADASLPLRFAMDKIAEGGTVDQLAWHGGDEFIVDFGGHRAGYLSFSLCAVGGMPDSPVRLKITFGEVPTDVAESFEPYEGWLSSAWLPVEVVTIDDLPQQVRIPRRHAFRYVKIEVLATSRRFGVRFEALTAHAVTSAAGAVAPLESRFPDWARRIDEISVATLRSCLQTTFEDGPRRDRRLWVGDLRLQALANYATFGANDVVKRCLYLFAGLPRSDGLVNACVYERPNPTYADTVCLDYAALYNVTLKEYVEATADLETGMALWPVAARQIELLWSKVGADDLFVDTGETWCFIDWDIPLERSTAMQGVIIFALRSTADLAKHLGKQTDASRFEALADRMVSAARHRLFDAARGVFVSGVGAQVSCASQAWMVLARVPANAEQAASALRAVMADPEAIKPMTPYLYHYIAEAMLRCGMRDEALALVKRYWGGMVDAGADTFWEVYDPEVPLASPYGSIHINSYCHAWSCTPCWFFRAHGLGAKDLA